MKSYLANKNIRLRCKKSYSDAHTHIIIGEVIEESASYVVVKGRTFHFRRLVDQLRSQVHCGDVMIRIIPWENIEIIHWLCGSIDLECDINFDSRGNLILDGKTKTIVAERRDGLE